MKKVFGKKKDADLNSSKIQIKLPNLNKSREEIRNEITESFISKHKMSSAQKAEKLKKKINVSSFMESLEESEVSEESERIREKIIRDSKKKAQNID